MFAEVSRMRGAPFYVDPGAVRNHYKIRIQNKRNQPVTFQITLENAPPGFTLSGHQVMYCNGLQWNGTVPNCERE